MKLQMIKNMKLNYILTMIMAAGMAAGCTETSKVAPEEYKAPLFLQSSDTKIVFDREGGKALVTMATNAESWSWAAKSGDWFAVSVDTDSCLVVEAQANNGPVRTDEIIITAAKGDESKEVSLKVTQRTDDATNLSAAGTANCYIARTNGSYKFRADIKGNGGNDGKTEYIKTEGLEIKGAVYSDLLWEARNDGDRSMSYEIIDGTPSYYGGYISFSTGRSEGNALIAIRDAKGKILWSWHIWVTDKEVTTHDHIGPEGSVLAQIMDRNLGAMNNIPMDIGNRGMFYQMGRKDPFIPSRSPYLHSEILNDPACNLATYETGDGSGKWEFGTEYTSQPINSEPGNIPFASAHPMRFLLSYDSSDYQWYMGSGNKEATNPGLWGEEKTIFDPCPPGYKVPGKNMWGAASESGKATITGGGSEEYDGKGENPKYLWNVQKDCGRIWKATGDFYPAAGLMGAETAPYNYASEQAFYLTSQEDAKEHAMVFVAEFSDQSASYDTRAQVYAGQVRCVKE